MDDKVSRRREIFDFYRERLGKIEGVKFLSEAEGAFSRLRPCGHYGGQANRWLSCVLFDQNVWPVGTNERVRVALEKEGIESRPLWKPMHLQPVFKGCDSFLSGVSEGLFNTGLCLPSGSGMTDGEMRRVTDSLVSAIR